MRSFLIFILCFLNGKYHAFSLIFHRILNFLNVIRIQFSLFVPTFVLTSHFIFLQSSISLFKMFSAPRFFSLSTGTTRIPSALAPTLTSCFRFHSSTSSPQDDHNNHHDHGDSSQSPPKIISPVELAKRLAQSGSKTHHNHYQQSASDSSDHHHNHGGGVSGTKDSRPIMSGVKRETLLLYRSLLKATKSPKIPQSPHHKNQSSVSSSTSSSSVASNVSAKETIKSSGSNKKLEFNTEQLYIRQQFQEHKKIPRGNIEKIQWHIHHGQTKLEEIKKLKKHRTGFSVMTFS